MPLEFILSENEVAYCKLRIKFVNIWRSWLASNLYKLGLVYWGLTASTASTTAGVISRRWWWWWLNVSFTGGGNRSNRRKHPGGKLSCLRAVPCLFLISFVVLNCLSTFAVLGVPLLFLGWVPPPVIPPIKMRMFSFSFPVLMPGSHPVVWHSRSYFLLSSDWTTTITFYSSKDMFWSSQIQPYSYIMFIPAFFTHTGWYPLKPVPIVNHID